MHRPHRIGEKQFLGVGSSLIDSGALYLLSPIIDMVQRIIRGCDDVRMTMTQIAGIPIRRGLVCVTGFLRLAITILCSGVAPILKGNHMSCCDYSDPMAERLDNMQKN